MTYPSGQKPEPKSAPPRDGSRSFSGTWPSGRPIPRRSRRPPMARPELEPGFPVEYIAAPETQAAVRVYAAELAWQMKIAAVLEKQLDRLVWLADQGITMRSTDAQIALAILKTIDMVDRVTKRLRDLTPDTPEQHTEATMRKLDLLASELVKLRKQRRKEGHPGAVAADAEVLDVPQDLVSGPSDKSADPANPLP